jgi:glucose/arabinose dehydrogenase
MSRVEGARRIQARPSVPLLTSAVLALAGCMSGVPTASPSASVGTAAPTVPATGAVPTVTTSASATAAPTATAAAAATPATAAPLRGLRLQVVASGLQNPVDVKARPGDGALFVGEQTGVIRRVRGGAASRTPLLDIREIVNDVSIEQGLLGFAFHPKYPSDPRVFIYHSKSNNDNVLVSYETRGDADRLDPRTRKELLTIDKEPGRVRHNAGTVVFGPNGLLYVSVGDAERGRVNGQNPATLPATILRLDVDGEDPYAIPDGNPFAGGARPGGVRGRAEVWWFGFRNPWRFSIDGETGLAYVGDVGQETTEEVNVAPIEEGGRNFGWPAREGKRPYFRDIRAVSKVTDPVVEIRHDDRGKGCSVTGGEVYRGAAIPELDGHYFYADWCFGWIRSFRYDAGKVAAARDWSGQLRAQMISSFGHDANGELLVLDWAADTLSRVVPVR